MQNGGHRFDFRDYVRLFQKRKWLILTIFAAATAAGFGLTRLQEPAFEASSIVMVKSYPRGFFMITGNARLPESLSLETQASVAQSSQVADAAYEALKEEAAKEGRSVLFDAADIRASLSARPSEP
ncbi:MAG: Wzz/FepE/Etk N-terminal domain-containing protein, partial [Armatimonadota bacterium]